jgi:hypothetical protein
VHKLKNLEFNKLELAIKNLPQLDFLHFYLNTAFSKTTTTLAQDLNHKATKD